MIALRLFLKPFLWRPKDGKVDEAPWADSEVDVDFGIFREVEGVPFAGGEAGAVPPCSNAFFTASW